MNWQWGGPSPLELGIYKVKILKIQKKISYYSPPPLDKICSVAPVNFNKYHISFYHRPPEGCLQYFVGTEGRLKSFNWDGGNGHLESQAYTMCIRQEKGFCCNKYSLCATETVFTLGLHMMVATPGMAQADGLCTQDYIIIEGIFFLLYHHIHRAVNRVRLIFRSCGPALPGSTGPLFQNAS